MTLTLILMRHAKSDWGNPLLTDHDRPLNKRGRASARALGDWLRREGWLPDRALSSTSLRTRETWEGLKLTAPVTWDAALYHAEPETMWEVLAGADGQVVLMLGHNPGIAEFAGQLVARAPDHDQFGTYPTCATLVVQFEAPDWASVRPGTGQARAFVVPRELTE
ncbi:MAG: histidine phosphatase family protein [Rhodobacteraceae bacterium]|nr:MAG: histidine phosphatase family protein [Paracoccaceae bacterium]